MITQDKLELWGKHLDEKIRKSEITKMQAFSFFLDQLILRTQRNRDAVVAVTGERGMGKSTLSLVAGMALNHRFKELGIAPKPVFSWNNICFRSETIGDIVERAGAETAQVYDIDEAIDVAHAKEAMTKINRELGRFMTKARKNNNIYFWNIPAFPDLDRSLRNNVIHYWIHVFLQSSHVEHSERYAIAAFMRKDLNPFISDKWGLDENKIQFSKLPTHNPRHLYRAFRKAKNFVAFVAFPTLPLAIEDEYVMESRAALKDSGKAFRENLALVPRGRKKKADVPAPEVTTPPAAPHEAVQT